MNPIPIVGTNCKAAMLRCFNKCKAHHFADRYINRACLTLLTGESSGFIVIDIDTHEENKDEKLSPASKYILDIFSKINTPTVRTASGGYHVYVKSDD